MLVKQEGFQARAHNPVFFQEACVESVDSCPVPPSQHQQLHYVCTRELASHQEISVSICFPGDKTPGKVWAEEGNPSPWSTLEKTFSFPKPSPALLAAAAFRHQLNPISLLHFGHFRQRQPPSSGLRILGDSGGQSCSGEAEAGAQGRWTLLHDPPLCMGDHSPGQRDMPPRAALGDISPGFLPAGNPRLHYSSNTGKRVGSRAKLCSSSSCQGSWKPDTSEEK